MASDPKSSTAVLILAGGSSRVHLPNFPLFRHSPAFLPINSRSLGKFVIDFYLDKGFPIYLALNPNDVDSAREEFGSYGGRISIVDVGPTDSVIDSLSRALQSVRESDVIINPVTTIPKVLPNSPHSLVIDTREQLAENWAAVAIESGSVRFIKKNTTTANVGFAFSGILRCRRDDLIKSAANIEGMARNDLMVLAERVHVSVRPFDIVQAEWYDCGHAQNYFRTRKKIFNSRYFNSISLDEDTDILHKKSIEKLKIRRESEYLAALPPELQLLFPRQLWMKESPNEAEIAMEFYGYPTLAEVILYWDIPIGLWVNVFEKLSGTLRRFHAHPAKIGVDVWEEMYLHKVTSRWNMFRKQTGTTDAPRSLNGTKLLTWAEIEKRSKSFIEKLARPADLTAIHGDFCLNNILCDPYIGLIKLLDPRGSFGDSCVGPYGDRKYDWAKLGHSIVGRYDYIVNDLFHIEGDGKEQALTIYDRNWQPDLDALFWNHCDQAGIESSIVNFIMGSLFISATALHPDAPKRQQAFHVLGLKFYTEALSS